MRVVSQGSSLFKILLWLIQARSLDALSAKPEGPAGWYHIMREPEVYRGRVIAVFRNVAVNALTPAQGCDKLYPDCIASKAAQLATLNDNLIEYLLTGQRRWKWPIMATCFPPFKQDREEGRILFACVDKFHEQLKLRIPYGSEVSSQGPFGILCPRTTTEAVYIFHPSTATQVASSSHIQSDDGFSQPGWWECFCRPRNYLSTLVHSLLFDCLDAVINQAAVVIGWMSSDRARVEARNVLTIQEIDPPFERRTRRFWTMRPSLAHDMPPGAYRACLDNREVTDTSLHLAWISLHAWDNAIYHSPSRT